MKTYNFS